MGYPHISIIILNWNNWNDTLQCLESVYQIDYSNYSVILVDNGSTNDSVRRIKDYCNGILKTKSKFFDYYQGNKPISFLEIKNESKKHKNILNHEFIPLNDELTLNKDLFIIKNSENYGYTEGNNVGIKFAFESLKPDHILVLNNDVVVTPNLLGNMVQMLEKYDRIALIQPKSLYYDEPTRINSTGNKLDLFGGTCPRGRPEIDSSQYDNFPDKGFFYASGACLLVTKPFISQLIDYNVFDSLLFAYHDDIDISFTARIYGFKILYCPDAICYHKESASLKDHDRKFFWAQRNNFRVLLKHYSIKYLILIFPATLLIELIFTLFATFFTRRLNYLKILLDSILWNINHINDTFKKRNIIQSNRQVSDNDLFKFMNINSFKLSSNLNYVLTKIRKKIFDNKKNAGYN
ncbi:MAG: glycosyltransferase family 2 protein [Methanobacterium sp.]